MDLKNLLRLMMLEITKDKTIQERADAVNLLEMLLDDEISIEEMVKSVKEEHKVLE